jgi:hypothetical protein
MSVNLGHVAAMGTPAQGGFTVTPSDSVDFDLVARGLYVSVAGAVTVVAYDGTVVTFPAVPAGAILPIVCTRVNDTGTDASLGIVGLY